MREHASDTLVSLGGSFIAQAASAGTKPASINGGCPERRRAALEALAEHDADLIGYEAARSRVMAGPTPLVARADGTVEAIRASQSVTRGLGRLAETIASIP